MRDHNGVFQAGASFCYSATPDPEAAEAAACRSGLQLAHERSIAKVHVELDCQGLVPMLNNPDKSLSANGPMIMDIKEKLKGFQESKVTWVHRSANGAAHALAREGLHVDGRVIWESAPLIVSYKLFPQKSLRTLFN